LHLHRPCGTMPRRRAIHRSVRLNGSAMCVESTHTCGTQSFIVCGQRTRQRRPTAVDWRTSRRRRKGRCRRLNTSALLRAKDSRTRVPGVRTRRPLCIRCHPQGTGNAARPHFLRRLTNVELILVAACGVYGVDRVCLRAHRYLSVTYAFFSPGPEAATPELSHRLDRANPMLTGGKPHWRWRTA